MNMQVAKINADNTIDEIGFLKELFPNTSFPKEGPNEAWYTENSAMPVILGLPYDPATQKIEKVDPFIESNAVYTCRVVDLTSDEQAALVAAQDAETATINRKKRDDLLAETDWMVIKATETSATLASDWATYRQELRDITAHERWPNLRTPGPVGDEDDDWPTPPSS